MKRITAVLIALLLMCGMTILSFAQASQATGAKKVEVSTETIRGKIISVDTAKNEIVVKENKTGTEKTIVVDSIIISSLKANEMVKVTLKSGSNVAEKVKDITPPVAVTKKSNKK